MTQPPILTVTKNKENKRLSMGADISKATKQAENEFIVATEKPHHQEAKQKAEEVYQKALEDIEGLCGIAVAATHIIIGAISGSPISVVAAMVMIISAIIYEKPAMITDLLAIIGLTSITTKIVGVTKLVLDTVDLSKATTRAFRGLISIGGIMMEIFKLRLGLKGRVSNFILATAGLVGIMPAMVCSIATLLPDLILVWLRVQYKPDFKKAIEALASFTVRKWKRGN